MVIKNNRWKRQQNLCHFHPQAPFPYDVYINLILLPPIGIELQTIRHNLDIFVNYIHKIAIQIEQTPVCCLKKIHLHTVELHYLIGEIRPTMAEMSQESEGSTGDGV